MKKSTRSLLKGIAMMCLAATGTGANAAVYVATATGAWTSASTWGGVAPGTNITADNITIAPGVIVYLDQNVVISTGSSALTVSGQLNSMAGEDLSVINGATLAGSGSITVDSLTLGGLGASLGSNGNIMARTINFRSLSIASGATMTATESIRLDDGILTLTTVNISLNNNGKVYKSGGEVAIGGIGANLNLNTYDVVYTDVSTNAGLELTGTGLRNIYVDVPSGSTVSLTTNVTIDDTLHLNSGVLDLNGSNLTFAGDGNVAAGGSGTISSDEFSTIQILSDNNFLGGLNFTAGADTVNTLWIDMGNPAATAMLGSDLTIYNALGLQTGKLDVDGNYLTLGAGASVMGGSANSYVITSDAGDLTMNMGAGTTDSFMIGTSANFAPIAVTVNSGSTGGYVSASVEAGLLSGIFVGNNLAATQPVVNATWVVYTDASSNINMNIAPVWSAGMEVNGFNRTEAFVSMSPEGTWDVVASAAAATTANGMYSLTRANVTSDVAAYSVMDKDAVNNVEDITTGTNGITVYPNPVVNTLYFKTSASLRAPVQVNIYDVTGHLVKTAFTDNSNGVSVADLATGFYTAQFTSGEFKAIEKFVKQ